MKRGLFFLLFIMSFGIGLQTNAITDRVFGKISNVNILDNSRFASLPQPEVLVITVATPVPGYTVVGAKGEIFAFFDLDATRSRMEDVLLQSLTVTDTMSLGTDYSGLSNLQLWGDPDPRDADTKEVLLSAVEYNASKTEFQFEKPIYIKRSQINRLTLKTDVISTVGASHTFSVRDEGAKFVGASSGREALVTYSGNGQAQTIRSVGRLTVSASSSRPSSTQLVASITSNFLMSYRFSALYEPIEIQEFYIATEGSNYPSSNVSRVKLYLEGFQIGSTNGYTLDADGKVFVRLESGTMIVPEDDSLVLDIKVDISDKTQLIDNSTLEIGLGDSDGNNSQWGSNGSYGLGNYLMVAKGNQSKSQFPTSAINSTGETSGYVAGSFTYRLYDGVVVVTLNTGSPNGLRAGGQDKEVFRFNFSAAGDDISIENIEFQISNTCTIFGTGKATLLSSDRTLTYATWEQGTSWFEQSAFSVSDDAQGNVFQTPLEIQEGTTKTVMLLGDTTGCTTNNLLQASVVGAVSTVSGVAWKNQSENVVDSTLTRELPLSGYIIQY